ncbi:hypothetical protein [Thalassomonas actiniarum]|uniref:Uncharacterized protein n=1 Tax=Thalassomonas actiniarum TaxID=485447 RepID=A0AAE9YW07_9GAMM|nr:hypothetical protein [Thalassomonas actiniarum]WDE02215.1 hypothetical protein SG35_031145 [Thalassomonas actiniarum]
MFSRLLITDKVLSIKLIILCTILLSISNSAFASLMLNSGNPLNYGRTHVSFSDGVLRTEGFLDYGDYIIQGFRVDYYSPDRIKYFHATNVVAGCHENASGCYLSYAEKFVGSSTHGSSASGFKILRKDGKRFDLTNVTVKSRSTIPLLGYDLGESILLASNTFSLNSLFSGTMNEFNLHDFPEFGPGSRNRFRNVDLGGTLLGVEQAYFFSSNEFNYDQLFVNKSAGAPTFPVNEPQTLILFFIGTIYFIAFRKSLSKN